VGDDRIDSRVVDENRAIGTNVCPLLTALHLVQLKKEGKSRMGEHLAQEGNGRLQRHVMVCLAAHIEITTD
jgi:hypothetical protein